MFHKVKEQSSRKRVTKLCIWDLRVCQDKYIKIQWLEETWLDKTSSKIHLEERVVVVNVC